MRIRIQLSTLMRIRILLLKMMRVHADPEQWKHVNENTNSMKEKYKNEWTWIGRRREKGELTS
jgi:hypothetical protein